MVEFSRDELEMISTLIEIFNRNHRCEKREMDIIFSLGCKVAHAIIDATKPKDTKYNEDQEIVHHSV